MADWHLLYSMTLLGLGIESELSTLSKMTLLSFGRDVTLRNVSSRLALSLAKVRKASSECLSATERQQWGQLYRE